MFEKASKFALRYMIANRVNGKITTEDLWNLSLTQLDSLAKSLNKELKAEAEESFIQKKTRANTELELKFEIVKHVITVKLDEEARAKDAVSKREKRQRLLELITNKENEMLSSKSVDELRNELAHLDD